MIAVAATQNKNKIREFVAILEPFEFDIITRAEAGIGDFDIVEDGDTFEENSLKKARAIMEATGRAAVADDSGLEVEALGGEPGVYSARYAGVDGDDDANNRKLMAKLEGISRDKRRARFVAVITLVYPDGRVVSARGECAGIIGFSERGEGGFGYDPLFIPDGYDKSFAELSLEEKNSISHRGRALRKLQAELESVSGKTVS